MAITTATYSFTANSPGGPLVGQTYRCVLRGAGLEADGDIIEPGSAVEATSDGAGLVAFAIWENDDGTTSTSYELQVARAMGSGATRWETLGYFAAQAGAGPNISTILTQTPVPGDAPHTILTTAAYDALIATYLTDADTVSANDDTTAGRLLTVGYMGMGDVPPLVGNIDQYDLAPGMYSYVESSGSSNGPAPVGVVLVSRRAASGGEFQTFMSEAGNGTLWTRSRVGGAWTGWVKTWNTRNVLAAMGHDGTYITGGLMTSGTSGGGTWAQYADGHMVAARAIDLGSSIALGSGTFANPYRTASLDVALPAQFIAAPVVAVSIVCSDAALAGPHGHALTGATTTTVTGLRALRLTGDATPASAVAHITAIGRWRA